MEILEQVFEVLQTPILKAEGATLTPMSLIQAALIVLGVAVLSRMATRFLRRTVFSRAGLGVGVQVSITRVLHYLFVLLGVFIALEHLGIDLTALAAAGAIVGVGVGFGLQNIASNFISGLILLFERPIEVEDFVEVAGVQGRVKAIRARSTVVETLDNVSIIVPNSHFISESVTNWSYRDSRARIHIEVGVSYGSDVDRVRDVLLGVAESHTEVLQNPSPSVQFQAFGDSSLNFALLCWVNDPTRQYVVRSDLNFEIVHAFRSNEIEIPFPQRDLHVRSSIPIPRDPQT